MQQLWIYWPLSTEDTGAFIRADARVVAATLKASESADYRLGKDRFGYLVPATGDVEIEGLRVGVGIPLVAFGRLGRCRSPRKEPFPSDSKSLLRADTVL